MDLVEENFPRGGKKANTTPISARKRKTVTNDNLFDLHRKKDVEVAKNSKKKKKKKKVSADKRHEPMKEYDDDDDDDDFLMENQKGLPKPKYAFHSDVLKMKNISEGMLLLGCIKEVRQYEIVVSLPGGLSGYVDVENLNQMDTNTLKKKGEDSHKLLLVDLYPVGLAVRCRVLGVFETMHGGRSIKLSLKPQDVNSGLSATILHPGMVLSGCVSSVEDHGYIVDIGVKISAVFLSKAKSKKYEEKFNGGRELAIGQPVFCVVDAVKAGGRMVQLSAELPVLLRALATVNQGWTLYTLLPGLVVEASVTKVTRNAVMLEFLSSFEGIVDLMHLTSTTGPSVGDQVKACVLYVHPTKRLVGLSLHPKLLRSAPSIPSPAAPDLGTIQHDCTVTSYLAGTGVFLTLGNGTKAFAKMKDLLDDVSVEPKTIFIVGSKHSCRLLDISPIDQMVIVSLKRSVMEAPFLFLSDLHIGQIVEGKVLSVDERGMFVHLGDYLRGFVPRIHLADVPLSHPERRFNPDEIISCKVLNLDHKRCAAVLTCKPTLLASQFPPVCSREAAVPGTVAHGCVICVRDFCVVVQLLGDVRGVIPRWQLGLKPHKKPSDAYYLGQVLKVCVLGYDAHKDQIMFSLETAIAEERQMAPERLSTDDHRAAQEVKPKELQLGSRTSGRVKLLKPCHALITLPGGLVGRLHVSELFNSVEPGSFPIQSLKVGQKITTTVIGNWKSKKSLRTSRLELSFRRRKLSSNTQDDLKSFLASYRPGQKVMCFVQSYKKQQKAVWVRLTPTVRGKVERLLLDLRPKVAKCPGKHLKRGQAVEGKVIARRPRLNRLDISLSGFHKPIPGSLTLAFVQEVNPSSGLVLELPQCKVGKVGLTEMADCYSDQPLAGFAPKDVLLCCILAKDENGIFVTSLRTSHISPEVAEDALDKTVSSAADVVEGSCMRGYVQRVSARNVFITLSWTLKGRLSYRNLSQYSVNEAAIFKKHLPLGRLVTVKVISVNGETGLVELSALPQDTGQDDLLPESLGLPLRGSTGNGATKDADKVVPQKNKTHASVKEEPLATVMVNDVPFTGTMVVDEVTVAVTVAPDKRKRKRKTIKQTEEESAFDKTVPLKVTTVSESADVKKGKKTKQKSSVAKAVKNVTAVMNRSTEEVLPEPLADKSPALENKSSANVANKRKCEETQMESNSKGGPAKEDWTNMKDGGDGGVDMYIQVGSDDGERKNEKIRKCNQGKRPEQKAPRLQLDEGFVWDVTAADLHVPMANADDSSSGDDSDAEACTSPITGRRMTRKEQLREERKLACREREMADPTQVPRSVDDFERLLLGSPNSSLLWVQFMAFHLQSSEVEQARAVAERALRTISFREEQEKLNVWVALLNLENMYGSEENLNSVFQRALRYNDALKVYHRLVQIYTHSDKPQKAEALFETMVRKFRQEKTIWVNFGMLQMQRGQMESVRSLLQRALKCLPDRDHIEIIVKFAQLHFRSGGAAHGNSLLENVVTNFPRRTDVWSIYLDMLIKYTTPEQARLLFERAINMDAPSKQMKFFFKRYMDFERSHGDEQKVQYVRQQALNYVEKQSNLPKDG